LPASKIIKDYKTKQAELHNAV
jgi:hypothetical protein